MTVLAAPDSFKGDVVRSGAGGGRRRRHPAAQFDLHLEAADAVVVGEGRLDSQTGEGEIILAILERVRRAGRDIPVVAVVAGYPALS